tara:strand:+ start:795 stop:1385 length:591 start_codon:yes stop_codon:yes gene_type:complete
MFNEILDFEKSLSEFTGAPYVVATDCCTHSLELCFIYNKIKEVSFTPFTYLSVAMLMHKLNIKYKFTPEPEQVWQGEYKFEGSNIWDSARRLERGMYKPGQIQCLSFGYNKPVEIGRGGAILLDNELAYKDLKCMAYDGRNIHGFTPWEKQGMFRVGYHYKPIPEECIIGNKLLSDFEGANQFVNYPDLRGIQIVE